MPSDDEPGISMDERERARLVRRLKKTSAEIRTFLTEQDKRLAEIRAIGRSPR